MLSRGSALLQQARGAKARNRINDRNWLPLEYPACYRVAQRRIANVDYLHGSPQILRCSLASGECDKPHRVGKISSTHRKVNEPLVPCLWHKSNRGNPGWACLSGQSGAGPGASASAEALRVWGWKLN